MFLCPGFAASLWDSRDEPVDKNLDEDFVMKDIHDADAWNESHTGLIHHIGENGTVKDMVPEGQPPLKKLNSHQYSLYLTLNSDWWVTSFSIFHCWHLFCFRFGFFDNQPYSAGGIYIVINDLPHEMYFLQVNAINYTVTPGPHEPNELQLLSARLWCSNKVCTLMMIPSSLLVIKYDYRCQNGCLWQRRTSGYPTPFSPNIHNIWR